MMALIILLICILVLSYALSGLFDPLPTAEEILSEYEGDEPDPLDFEGPYDSTRGN